MWEGAFISYPLFRRLNKGDLSDDGHFLGMGNLGLSLERISASQVQKISGRLFYLARYEAIGSQAR